MNEAFDVWFRAKRLNLVVLGVEEFWLWSRIHKYFKCVAIYKWKIMPWG